jgi:26S proteasome regulatory subunit N9
MKMMALLELIFNLPNNRRKISFKTISQTTQLDIEKVEILLMKAMSLKLIKGLID